MGKIKKRTAEQPKEIAPAVVLDTLMMDVDDLRQYHKNTRRGDVEKVAKSLHINGQFKPIVVNVGTATGRAYEVLAGNHTLQAAKKETVWRDSKTRKTYHKMPWEQMLVSLVDVDDDMAARINVVDNQSHEGGTYDEPSLAALVQSIDSTEGLGFDADETEELLSRFAKIAESTPSLPDLDRDTPRADSQDDYDDGEHREKRPRDRDRDEPGEAEADDLEDVEPDAELQIVLEHRMNNMWKGSNEWDVPELLPDMLVQALPSNSITCWGGEKATPDDGEKWFLYNYRMGERNGMPYDRTILAFNTHDHKFSNWWEKPAFYVAQYMAAGIRMAVVPDFSFYHTEYRSQHLWNVTRAQWMGRFFQEAGLKVIPRLQFDYMDPNSLDIALLGVPRNAPVLATSQQNFDRNNPEQHFDLAAKHLQEALDELQPETLLFYSGPPGRRLMEERIKFDGKVVFVENYAAVRRGSYYDKGTGKKRITKKQVAAIRKKHDLDDQPVVDAPRYEDDDD